MREVFIWFWNFTSFPGLAQCRDSDNIISKVYWIILTLSGYALTMYTFSMTIQSFFNYNTNTRILFGTGVAFRDRLNFPSVTVCNTNRIHCGHLYDLIQECTKVIQNQKYNFYRPLENYCICRVLVFITIIRLTQFQNDKECKKESTYCSIFVMAQCPLSLAHADRFTHGAQYSRQIICDNSTKAEGKDIIRVVLN